MRFLALLLLTACAASPDPLMWGQSSQAVTVNDRSYTVYWTDRDFEIIRHGWASPREYPAIRADMLALVPQVTGCSPLDAAILGDAGEVHGPLIC